MWNKLLVSMAALAIGLAVVSCEKSPNEEPAAQKSGSTAPEGQQTQSAQDEQRGAEKQAKQSEPTEAQQQPTGQAANQAVGGEKQSQQEQRPQVAQQGEQPKTTQGEPTQGGQPRPIQPGASQSSAQSETGPAGGQPQAIQPQQSQAQNQAQPQQSQAPPNQQKNQPGQNQQATGTPAVGPLNLTHDQALQAQKLLKAKGFDLGNIDGILGPRTRRALIAFQRQQGLEPSGQIDQQTASALGLSNEPATTSGHTGAGPQ
jgi:hypothetical protein